MAKQHSVTAFKVIRYGVGAAEPQPHSELRGEAPFCLEGARSFVS